MKSRLILDDDPPLSSVLRVWFRLSVVLGIFVGLGLGTYTLLAGKSLPIALGGVSHWWDMVAPALFVAVFFLTAWIADILDGEDYEVASAFLLLCGFSGIVLGIIGCVMFGIFGALLMVLGCFLLFIVGWLLVALVRLVASIRFGSRRSFRDWVLDLEKRS